MNIKLTVFFEAPFWVGTFERMYEGDYEVSKIVFGSEPKDYEVYEFILKNFNNLKFSSSISDDQYKNKRINPKRLQRKIKKEVKNTGTGTKAQRALKLQQETTKQEKKKKSRKLKDEEKKMKFDLKQQKKKEKHKGH